LSHVLSNDQVNTLNRFARNFHLDQKGIKTVTKVVFHERDDGESDDSEDREVVINKQKLAEARRREHLPPDDGASSAVPRGRPVS